MLKNNIHAVLSENVIDSKKEGKNRLFSPKSGKEALKERDLSGASEISIRNCLELLWKVKEEKDRIMGEILLAGKSLKGAVKLLITIKGIAPLVALAFLADIGDIIGLRILRKMNAYLGIVPRAKDSGGKSQVGHITRESRNLTRTLLTQSIHHVRDASSYFRIFYENLAEEWGEFGLL